MKYINENGRSMVEMLGVLAIIGVLSVGGIAGYSKAMNKYKINKTNDQVSMLVANIRTLFSSRNNYAGLNNGKAVQFGVVPNDMYTTVSNPNYSDANFEIKNAFGGSVFIKVSGTDTAHTTSAFTVEYKNIPQEACVNILTSDWGSGQGSGLIAIGVVSDATASATTAGNQLDTIHVGDAGTDGSIGTPGGKNQTAPFTVGDAVTACKTTNAITWKYY